MEADIGDQMRQEMIKSEANPVMPAGNTFSTPAPAPAYVDP